MGCFPACFGNWRQKETMKNVQDQCLSPSHELRESVNLSPKASTESLKEEEIVNPMKLVSESECKCEEQMNISNGTTSVFDHSNVEKGTNELTSSNSDDKLVQNENEEVEKERNKDCVAVNSKEITSERSPVQEESSESLFSLSIDSRKHVFAVEMGDKEVNSPLKKNGDFLVKSVEKISLKYDEDKENVPLSKDAITKQSFDHHQLKKRDSEIAVDTSLSSWLVESEKSPKEMSIGNSPESEKNYGRGEILGAITSPTEFKELNGILSGGSTPCCSADDQLGIGTVGSYWRRRGRAGEVEDMGSGSSCRVVSTVCTKV